MEDLHLEPTGDQVAQREKLAAIGHVAHDTVYELNRPLAVSISNRPGPD